MKVSSFGSCYGNLPFSLCSPARFKTKVRVGGDLVKYYAFGLSSIKIILLKQSFALSRQAGRYQVVYLSNTEVTSVVLM